MNGWMQLISSVTSLMAKLLSPAHGSSSMMRNGSVASARAISSRLKYPRLTSLASLNRYSFKSTSSISSSALSSISFVWLFLKNDLTPVYSCMPRAATILSCILKSPSGFDIWKVLAIPFLAISYGSFPWIDQRGRYQ